MFSAQALQLIDIVAQVGSFTAAANKLHKVPSAVSYAVKQVEDELGVILFERHHRSVSLTVAGEHFVKEARQILAQMEQVKVGTQQIANGWQPKLSIAIDNIVRPDKISVFIADFYKAFKDVELDIHIEVFNGVWEALSTGRCDIAIGATTAIPTGGDYKYKDMGNIEWSFLVSKNHPLAKAEHDLADSELTDYASICIEDTARDIPKRSVWRLNNQRRILVPDWVRALNCYINGLGVGYMPAHVAGLFVKSGALIEKQLENPVKNSPCCLAWNGKKHSQAIDWVIQYLGDTEKLHKDWLS
ncbi:DNA-binding transcriptional activator PunR [Shewanella gelidii]|uniref:LysR family transcriptional regulator n=1 Tax=Shewanella gelidii TaxID=1642821 RepID=A0A917JW85_9GAMM|nr:DNA-binding transcriptional activator PunR [Shewanella gelidii]MCL1098028.1 LysR family transcriptional regulator [Shewanella gelidii]GGI85535.1 LysR family transcriptional regulator [Shewanella gelidii]